jgi:hypothetical protein
MVAVVAVINKDQILNAPAKSFSGDFLKVSKKNQEDNLPDC